MRQARDGDGQCAENSRSFVAVLPRGVLMDVVWLFAVTVLQQRHDTRCVRHHQSTASSCHTAVTGWATCAPRAAPLTCRSASAAV